MSVHNPNTNNTNPNKQNLHIFDIPCFDQISLTILGILYIQYTDA